MPTYMDHQMNHPKAMNFTMKRFRRMNIAAIVLAFFAPWLTFCLSHALMSFRIHYELPLICDIVTTAILIIVSAIWAMSFYQKVKGFSQAQEAILNHRELQFHHFNMERRVIGDWYFFILTTCLLGLIFGLALGTRNFWANTQPYYDLTNLSHYTAVTTNVTHGQELMDAGQIIYTRGSTVNTKLGIGFRNVDTYCVAPIVPEGSPPLDTYDFWAVGLNCCNGGPSDFQCGGTTNGVPVKDGGGLRVMRNEDRSFYRLAIQQAESAFQIRANHPLFFYWVADPAATQNSYLEEAMRQFLIAMYISFGVQLVLVSSLSCHLSGTSGTA